MNNNNLPRASAHGRRVGLAAGVTDPLAGDHGPCDGRDLQWIWINAVLVLVVDTHHMSVCVNNMRVVEISFLRCSTHESVSLSFFSCVRLLDVCGFGCPSIIRFHIVPSAAELLLTYRRL